MIRRSFTYAYRHVEALLEWLIEAPWWVRFWLVMVSGGLLMLVLAR